MSNDSETRVRLLESARKEFWEKGYMKASLRSICKDAGVTTGALYFFFRDKEDLFASLVEEPLQKLYEIVSSHYRAEMELVNDDEEISALDVWSEPGGMPHSDDQGAAAEIVHYIYQHYDSFMMILTKSHGSRFEFCVEQFVEITEKHYRVYVDKMSKRLGTPPMEEYLIHWLAHMSVDMFVHLLTHETSEQAAIQHVEPIVQYMVDGWDGLFREKRES